MKIKTWNPDLSDKETADLAYWERNMLALRYAEGWYYDDVRLSKKMKDQMAKYDDDEILTGFFQTDWSELVPRFDGWRRVLSLDGGRLTFHIPDDFEVGDLPQINNNWDGHTTQKKWERIMHVMGIEVET